MRWIWGFAIEIYRLFVDDGFFALAIVAWLALLWLMLHLLFRQLRFWIWAGRLRNACH